MWIQVFCKANNGYREPSAAKRIDDHLTSQTAGCFVCDRNGIPIKNSADEYEVRVYVASQADIVKSILTGHYGLEIIRTLENQ